MFEHILPMKRLFFIRFTLIQEMKINLFQCSVLHNICHVYF